MPIKLRIEIDPDFEIYYKNYWPIQGCQKYIDELNGKEFSSYKDLQDELRWNYPIEATYDGTRIPTNESRNIKREAIVLSSMDPGTPEIDEATMEVRSFPIFYRVIPINKAQKVGKVRVIRD
jgi:hypothetical protein